MKKIKLLLVGNPKTDIGFGRVAKLPYVDKPQVRISKAIFCQKIAEYHLKNSKKN